MKVSWAGLVLLALGPVAARARTLSRQAENPAEKVVSLLQQLKTKVEQDGTKEQKSYDKYACWCENTLGEKASEITASKDLIEQLQTTIVGLNGDLGAHGADIAQLKKDIEKNLASQQEATELRAKEYRLFEEEKRESEQSIGALEAAIKVLSKAGTGRKGFLETLQEAQLLSVVAGVNRVLKAPAAKAVSEQNLQVVRRFVKQPEDFVGQHEHEGTLSAAQVGQNPFGDYAPQSTQVQGALKSLYDSFTSDIEKENVEEANKQKSYEELMVTKRQELGTLETTLQNQQMDEATKSVLLASSREDIDNAKAQLAADEEFFEGTKTACQAKAAQWAQRSRLRTEELHGIDEAIAILSSDKAKGTFDSAYTTFVQLDAEAHVAVRGSSAEAQRRRLEASQRLGSLSAKYQSLTLAQMAVSAQAGGHFDDIIATIDKMVALLRKEEQEDIAARDRCEGKVNANTNTLEDLEHTITRTETEITRLEGQQGALIDQIDTLEEQINATEDNITEMTTVRSQETAAFVQAVQDDQEAIGILDQAISALSRFYKDNGMPVKLLQNKAGNAKDRKAKKEDKKAKKEAKSTHEVVAKKSAKSNHESEAKVAKGKKADPEPIESVEPTWQDGHYKGDSAGGGIISILKLLKEDFEKEVQTTREAEQAAQVQFEKDRAALFEEIKVMKRSKVALEAELAALRQKIAELGEFLTMKKNDETNEQGMKSALESSCEWVKTHFDKRRQKRKDEMDGLQEARGYLAGMDDPDSLET